MRVMIFRTSFARQRIRRTQINLTHLNTFAIRSWVKKFIIAWSIQTKSDRLLARQDPNGHVAAQPVGTSAFG